MKVEHYNFPSGVKGSAAFSDDGVYRYALGRVWDDTYPPAVFVMLNPSTASAREDDPTIRRCVAYARSWDCGGLLVVNLFALRSTNPQELYTLADPTGPGNLTFIHRTIEAHNPAFVVCAWGAHRKAAETAYLFVAAMGNRPLYCLGRNLDGSPKHPLYLSKHAALEQYP